MPCAKRKPSRATPAGPRGFQRGPQAPLAVPRASELAAGFSLPFCPVKKEEYLASEKTKSYNARGGSSNVTQERKNKADDRGGVKTPPYRAGQTGNEPGTPRGVNPCRAAYMPPLQTSGIEYTSQKRCHKADARGGAKAPPYRAGQTGNHPQTPRGANPCRKACMPPLQTIRERQGNGQSKRLLRHARSAQKPDKK